MPCRDGEASLGVLALTLSVFFAKLNMISLERCVLERKTRRRNGDIKHNGELLLR